MPLFARSSGCPMPDNSKILGEFIEPELRMTSRDADFSMVCPSFKNRTPVHRLPLKLRESTTASVRIVKFGLVLAGYK